jgi:hypothetical protein
MLSAASSIPLHYAVLTKVRWQDKEHTISNSEVWVEIANARGEVVTIQRGIVGSQRERNLITVWAGPMLNKPGDYAKEDYYVRLEGAAQRERGFHRWFADWLGWSLPQVTRFDGSTCPLYVECIFPLMIIEQKHGWSGIQARMPTHFRIREMGKRAVEFILKMDVRDFAADRLRLRQELADLDEQWRKAAVRLEIAASNEGGIVKGIPMHPAPSWTESSSPTILMSEGPDWVQLDKVLENLSAEYGKLIQEEIPTVQASSDQLTKKLRELEGQLITYELVSARLFDDLQAEEAQNEQLAIRVNQLKADLKHFQDLRRLRELGSDVTPSLHIGICPTCSQTLKDTLLEQIESEPPMTMEENIAFIDGQIATFATMHRDGLRVQEAKRSKLNAVQARTAETRAAIRTVKQTLIADARIPSAAAIRQRIVLETRIARLIKVREERQTVSKLLQAITTQWRRIQTDLDKIPEGLSNGDKAKLQALQMTYVNQLVEYGFKSIPPADIQISIENYRPMFEGFDLGFNLSASDSIRNIWAYTFGLMEISRIFETNHLKCLLLDEPRQQQTDKVSFAKFAKRASSAVESNEQVIFLTSEDEETLNHMLKDLKYQYMAFDGPLIRPL